MIVPHEFRAFSEHFAILALIFSVGLMGIILFKSNAAAQQQVVWGIISLYIAWGVGHHLVRKDLTTNVVLEYILCGLLAGIIINSVLIQK